MNWYKLNQLDWREFLRAIPDASVDLIITDPPYASINRHRYGTHQRLKQWFPTIDNDAYASLLWEFQRILRDNRHLYIFVDEETQTAIKINCLEMDETGDTWFYPNRFVRLNGLRYWKSIIWDKKARGMGYHYATSHELIMFFEKGKRQLNDLTVTSILGDYPALRGERYPTEKPWELAQLLIGNSTMQGMTVLDPFMGSGAFGEAALRSGCNFIGNDLVPESVTLASDRLEKVQRELVGN